MFLQERAGVTRYSIISVTFLVYFGKCAVSFMMFLCKGDLRLGRLDTISLKSHVGLMITGGVLAFYDALSFLCLRKFDTATYQVLSHMRVIFVSFLWQGAFRRKLSSTQWQSLLLLIVAGITKTVARAESMDAALLVGPIWILFLQNGLCAAANVSSEALLKNMAVPTDLVNTLIYFWGLVWLVIVMLCTQGPNAFYTDVLSPVAWARLQADPCMIGSICSLIALGITTAYLLKALSCIVKEMSGAVVMIVSAILQRYLIGLSVLTSMEILGISLAVLSILLYCTDPIQETDPIQKHRNKDLEIC